MSLFKIIAAWIALTTLTLGANAGSVNYEVTIRPNDDEFIRGYAVLDWGTDGVVTGRMCVYEPVPTDEADQVTGQQINADKGLLSGVIALEGRSERTTRLKLRLKPSVEVTQSRLGPLFSNGIMELEFTSSHPFDGYLNSPFNSDSGGWQTLNYDRNNDDEPDRMPAPKILKVSFGAFPKELKPTTLNDTITERKGRRTRELNSRVLASMTPGAAATFFARNPIDDDISPGFVWVVYDPIKRDEIIKFLAKFPGTKLSKNVQPSCGVPYIRDTIRVSPLLEYYISYQLESSGLVVMAGPDALPRDSGMAGLHIGGTDLARILRDPALTLDQKSSMFGNFFDHQLIEFVSSKRPRFGKQSWEFATIQTGTELTYRARVVGAAISQCQSTGWEKFIIEIVPMMSVVDQENPLVVLNVVEGFEAPGALTQRPSDDRFRDNPLDDGRLSEIRDAFMSFLVKKGFPPDGGAASDYTSDACRL